MFLFQNLGKHECHLQGEQNGKHGPVRNESKTDRHHPDHNSGRSGVALWRFQFHQLGQHPQGRPELQGRKEDRERKLWGVEIGEERCDQRTRRHQDGEHERFLRLLECNETDLNVFG